MKTSAIRILLLASALALSRQVALSEHALFTRHTDTISIPGNSVVGEAMTLEARFMLLDGYPHCGWIFNEWTSGAEDKGLLVSRYFIGGPYYPDAWQAFLVPPANCCRVMCSTGCLARSGLDPLCRHP